MRSREPLPQALSLVREYEMFPPESLVVLAVSGGRDSMCLLHWAHAHAGALGIRLAVGHYHHGMRGAQADADRELVRTWCEAHAIPFHTGQGDVYARAKALGLGVEETGRMLRYAFLTQLALDLGAQRIATAHNADDNAETLLMHLLRGSGLHGLTGIPPRAANLVRPLLTTTRAQIDAYVARYAIPYGEDCTNHDLQYTRNRIRHQVTPVLLELNPRYIENVSHTIRLLQEDEACMNRLAWQTFRKATRRGEDLLLPAAQLSTLPAPVALRVARLLIGEACGGNCDCSAAHIESVVELARSEKPSGQVHLPRALTVRREYEQLIFTHAAPPPPAPRQPLRAGENDLGAWIARVEGPADGLTVRPRQTGDALRLPKQARKTLKRLMIEKKLPRHLRDSLPVAADEAGILAVAGVGENSDHPRYGTVRITFTPKTHREEG